MALVKCKECNKEISSAAEKCPYCGYKESFGTIISRFGWKKIVLGTIIMWTIFYLFDKNSTNSHNIITTDTEQTYSQEWRSPQGSEFRDIGRIIVQNGIKVCGEYYVKEIETNQYVIACSADGTTWDYFVVYTSIGKIYRPNDEMESKLRPPR